MTLYVSAATKKEAFSAIEDGEARRNLARLYKELIPGDHIWKVTVARLKNISKTKKAKER